MLGLGLGVNRPVKGFGRFEYLSELPSFVPSEYSLAFDASGAETLNDYEAGTLYFRDSNFDRVGATFSRTTTATRVNKQGLIETVAANVPRIDYTDGSAKLLMEPSRTNLIRYADFDAAVPTLWSVGFGTGDFTHTLTERLGKPAIIHEQTTSGRSPIQQFIPISPSTTYTFAMNVYDYENATSWLVNINDGVNNYRARPIDDLNDKGQLVFTFTTDAAASGTAALRVGIGVSSNDTGRVVFGIPQLEEGSYPTSYIPTAGSTVTRNADTANINNAVSTYDETFIYGSGVTIGDAMRLWFRNPAVSSSGWGLRGSQVYERISSITFKTIASPTDYGKLVIRAVNNGEFSYWYNGNSKEIVTTNIGDLASYGGSTLLINQDTYSGSTIGFGLYDQIIIFENTALTDSECEQLTS